MNRAEFLKRLETELAGVSTEERTAALQYFTMYFDDAGPEHEAEVIAELGSPAQIAAEIRSSSGEEPVAAPAAPVEPATSFSAEEKASTTVSGNPAWPAAAPPRYGWQQNYPPFSRSNGAQMQAATVAKSNRSNNIAIAIILLVVLSPLWAGLLGVTAGLLACLAVMLLVPLIIAVAFVAAGLATAIMGFVLMPSSGPNGLVAAGVGLLVVGIGLLCGYFGVWLVAKAMPAVIRACGRGIQKIAGLFNR